MKEDPVDASTSAAAESSGGAGSSRAAADGDDPKVEGKTAAEKKFEESQRKRVSARTVTRKCLLNI